MTTQTKDRTILSPPATSTHSGTTTSTLEISGMTCASCVRRVERALAKVEGVETANVNFASETALVTADASVSPERLDAPAGRAGYGAKGTAERAPSGERGTSARRTAVRVASGAAPPSP